MTLAAGQHLDNKYLLLHTLGQGGFGQVWLAQDTVLGDHHVAIKFLTTTKQHLDPSFLVEMRTLAGLNMPGIVTFHHHFTHKGQLALVMEHCPGGSLAQKLRKKQPMDAAEWVNQAVRWLLQLCDTLAAVHARGWVHHDIKPANILLRDGMAVIADFGIVNTTGGTVTYSSPSKGMGLAQRDDPREDIYALGVTLLELLNHSHPWHGLEGNALEAAKRQRTLPADLDARTWLLEIALRAAHPEGALRFQTAADMGSALRARSVPVRVGQGHETVNPLSPLFLVYMQANGALRYNFTAPKQVLEIFRALCQGQTQPHEALCKLFDQQTKHGQTAGCNQGHQEPRRL